MIGTTISHYRILEKLGGGGMGVVYKAEDTKLKRTVALKFLPPELTRDEEAKTRFVHEAQAASALQHPNICTIHDVDETSEGQLFIVMDCYEGETLKQMIERGPLPIDKAIDIATQVAQGLSKAHESGIVHRDIKPANIMIGRDGIARIVDFGLAKLSGRTLLTKTGSTLGTAAYMSPEQARGEQVDHHSDIWSLGVVLYEMLTGKRPFESDYEQALVYSILNQDPRPLRDLRPELPEGLEKICRRAMAKDTKDRYQTAGEFIADLESFKEGNQLSKSTRRLATSKRKLVYGGATLVVILIVIGAIYFLSPAKPSIDSIAVLPFENLSGDPEQDYLYDGIATDVIENLQKIKSIRAISWQSVKAYKKTSKNENEIAKELGVKAIVSVQARRMHDSVKISASLTQASPLKLLSVKSFYRSMSEIGALQGDIATAIVREINAVVTPFEQKRIEKSSQANPQAYEALQKARYYSDKNPQPEWLKSTDYFKLATTLDTTYAPAFVGLAGMYLFEATYSVRPRDEAVALAKAAVEKALQIDSALAEAHVVLGTLRVFDWDWSGAEQEYVQAISLNPNSADVHAGYGMFLLSIWRTKEAVREYQKAYEIDPSHRGNLGYVLFYARRYDEAMVHFKKTLSLSPGNAYMRALLGWSYAQKGMYAEAIEACQQAMSSVPDQTVLFINGWVLAKAGKRKEALVLLDRLKNLPAPLHLDPYNVALVYDGLGNTDSAFAFLERAYRERSGSMPFVKYEMWSDRLRSDLRYRDLLRRMNFPE